MGNVKNALTRKIGPLPAFAWLLLFGVGVWYYRNKMSGAASASGTGTGSVAPAAGPPQAQTTLQPGESLYDPNTGALMTAPGGGTGGGGDPSNAIDNLANAIAGAIAAGTQGGQVGTGTTPGAKPPPGKKPPKPGKKPPKPPVGKRHPKPKPHHTPKPKVTKPPSHGKTRTRSMTDIFRVGRGKPPSGKLKQLHHEVPNPHSTGATPRIGGPIIPRKVTGPVGTRTRKPTPTPATRPVVRQRPVAAHTPTKRQEPGAQHRPSAPPPRKVNRKRG